MRSREVSTGDPRNGYPCPTCSTTLLLIDKTDVGGSKGAWCPNCHTVWTEINEVSLDDLDELPEVGL